MATFRRFEDIEAWKKAREVTRQIYALTKSSEFSKDYGLRDQIRRASVSIMANIAEGFGRNSDKELANFLNIAIASALEVQSHLYVALDQHYLEQKTFDDAYGLLSEVSKMCETLAQHLRRS